MQYCGKAIRKHYAFNSAAEIYFFRFLNIVFLISFIAAFIITISYLT
jgi:hypothetical protein